MKKHGKMIALMLLIFWGYSAGVLYINAKVSELKSSENGGNESRQDLWDVHIDIEEPFIYADREELVLKNYETYRYDESGNLCEECKYDADGNLIGYETVRYDMYGNRTANDSYSYYFGGQERSYRYTYDLEGNLTQKEAYLDGRLSYLSEYREMDEGSGCVTTYFDNAGEVSSIYGQIYDEDGNELADYHYNADGTMASYEHILYDGDGRCVYRSVGRGDPSGTPMKELLIEWDDEAHTCVETLYEPMGHINAIQHSAYNEDWRQTRGLRYFSGYRGHSKEEWNLDLRFSKGYWAVVTDGLVCDEMEYSDNALTYYRVYQYDAAGNRIVKVEYLLENHFASTTLTYDIYDESGQRVERYTYRVTGNWLQESNDGSITAFHYDAEGRLADITVTGSEEVEKQLMFDEDGGLVGQYLSDAGYLWPKQPSDTSGEEREVPDEGQIHVVKWGESLWRIAEEYYGDGLCWVKIYEENWEIIGPDPDFIPPGMELMLPE